MRDAIRETQRRHNELDDLSASLAHAAAEFEPYRSVLTTALRIATDARQAVNHAQRRLDHARLRDRRHARHQLAAAEQSLAAASSNLNEVERVAGPSCGRYMDLRSRHEAASTRNMHRDILDQWGHYEVRADQLQQVLVALDAWKQWALGHDVPADRLSDGAAVLDEHARRSQQLGVRPLAETVRSWATEAGFELAHATTIDGDLPVAPRRIGRELGLGL